MNAFELTRALIDIDSVTPNEEQVGVYLAGYLSALAERTGGRVERIEVEPHRYNVLATWDAPVVTLSTHIDTVPPFFTSREDGEFIWGRGACDTKGLIAAMITAATLGMSKIVAGYVDQTSEEIVAAYTRERENWLRNRSAARAARIRDLLSGRRINVNATEATLGYRLRQYHVGLVCWTGDATAAVDDITRLEHAISHVAGKADCTADPVFLPRDESSAWAWLPLGIRDTFDAAEASTAGADADMHFAFGDAAKGATGFRITHQQAIAAQAVALAAGSPPPRAVTFSEVAPVAMMLGSSDLLRAWVLSTLGGLATDDEHQARLRDTLLAFLQSGGSYKTTAERLMLHKNTVQYRIRKAEESLGRPVGEQQHDVELALRASRWLGSSVLQPARGRS